MINLDAVDELYAPDYLYAANDEDGYTHALFSSLDDCIEYCNLHVGMTIFYHI